VIEVLFALPPHIRERLATALESGLLPDRPSAAALRSCLGTTESIGKVDEALQALAQMGATGPRAGEWIRVLDAVDSRRPRPDLVWSGPEVPGLHARSTRAVYDELLGTARESLWVSTFVWFDGPKAFDVLARRMDSQPGLAVTLLINLQRKRGDTTAPSHLVRSFADRFWSAEWPGRVHPRVYYDPRSLDPEGAGSVLHAKAVVADDEAMYVTSANLTAAAFDRNVELGLLVRDRALAASVVGHFRRLIELRYLEPLPH
jgi:phosphatidylserine/phosphatidylglycerophosphate/cardiolipin synthase-like enzyme